MANVHSFSCIVELFNRTGRFPDTIEDLPVSLMSDDKTVVIHAISVTEDFWKLFQEPGPDVRVPDGFMENFTPWISRTCDNVVECLLFLLTKEDSEIQGSCLHALMEYIQLAIGEAFEKYHFEWSFTKVFNEIIKNLVSQVLPQQDLLSIFKEYLSFHDIKLHVLKCLLKELDENEVTDIFLSNCFSLIIMVEYPDEFYSAENPPDENKKTTFLNEGFYLRENRFRKLLSAVWLKLFKFELPGPLLKTVLCSLHQKIIPHLQNPCLLTDFLTNAYTRGGEISLLSLQSLFFLMDKYNIEYHDFFIKLYSLTEKSIVNGPYGTKFASLAYTFLSSTHLPANLIAGFAKKLARIALTSEIKTISRIIPLINHLLTTHPTLFVMIDRSEPLDLLSDPFDASATDPTKANALESSLWEIKSLQTHAVPTIAVKAKSINGPLSVPECNVDISLHLQLSDNASYSSARKRKFEEVSFNVNKALELEDFWDLNNSPEKKIIELN